MKIRTGLISALSFLVLSVAASAGDFNVDPVHSNVDFTIRHLVSKVRGSFDKFGGSFALDSKAKTVSNVKFSVEASSVNTGNAKRDGHLKSPDFFNAEKFPAIEFVSKGSTKLAKKFKLKGEMTLLGQTRPMVWDVEYNGLGTNMMGMETAGFTATGKVKRSDFGMTWNKTLDKGGVVLGDDVAVTINFEANPAAAASAAAPVPAPVVAPAQATASAKK